MSLLGPPPLSRPSPERHFHVRPPTRSAPPRATAPPIASPARRGGGVLDLAALYDELNAKHFSGQLGAYEVVYRDYVPDNYDSPCGAEARFLADERCIEIKAGMTAEATRATLLHECVHVFDHDVIGTPYRTAEAAHGPSFRNIAHAIDPAGAPTTPEEAERWGPRQPTGRVSLPGAEKSRRSTGPVLTRSTRGSVRLR